MDVILLERVRNLGNIGDTLKVKAGYGRNYLIPKGKAVYATKENVEIFTAKKAELEKAAAESLRLAQGRADALSQLMSVTIAAHAADEGKLFGSIGTKEIADAITQAGVAIEKKEVSLPNGAFRAIGEYEVDILLHSDVTTTVKLVIVAE